MGTNPIIQQWQVTSTTNTSKDYTVSKRIDGTYSCSCPHWRFHKAPKPVCKHIAALRVDRLFGARTVDREQEEREAKRRYLEAREQITTPPPVAVVETFTVSVLTNPRRKFRADL